MSTITIPYTRPPIHDPRPTPQNKKFATLMGRMLEAHIRKWCTANHTHTPGTITLHYQPKKQQPDDTLRLLLTNTLLRQVTDTIYPTAVVTNPELHKPGHTPHPVWLDLTPRKETP